MTADAAHSTSATVIPFSGTAPVNQHCRGWQRWRQGSLPRNVEAIYARRDNEALEPAELLVLALLSALTQRKGFRGLSDDVFCQVADALHAKRAPALADALAVLMDRHHFFPDADQ